MTNMFGSKYSFIDPGAITIEVSTPSPRKDVYFRYSTPLKPSKYY